MNKFEKPILILGAGSWGTALALHLARLDQTVYLWSSQQERIAEMKKAGMNKHYLPDHMFPATLVPTADLALATKQCEDILIAIPSSGFRDILLKLKPHLNAASRLIWVTKGLDEKTGTLLHETFADVLGDHYPYAILSGPSFAGEVASGLPTAVVVTSHHTSFAEEIAKRFNSPVFRVYLSPDVVGVEIGGAAKNVMAIATGISDGMGLGANARCALITRGLAEISRLGTAFGANPETLMGLAGLGDLILTCTDNQSRNRRFGLSISQGTQANDAVKAIGQVVEGKRNAELVVKLAARVNVEMPIAQAVYDILEGKITPQEAMQKLLSRATKAEI